MKKIITLLLALTLVFGLAGCGEREGGSGTGTDTQKINILFSGWVNTPTTADDPYRAYIAENYGLNVQLNANSDFENAAIMAFNSTENRPDIISFPSYTSYRKFFKQGVLLDDWTPYLQYMPNFSKSLNAQSQAASKAVFTDGEKLTALWTPADPPTWSLKLREDWLDMYRKDKAKEETWAPTTPDDLLDFARWIDAQKKAGVKEFEDAYAFSTAGGGNSLGVLGTWMPLMFGSVTVAPYGFYVDKNGEVQFGTTDGSYKEFLDYFKIIVEEQLIEPAWFTQQYAERKRTYAGKIGIEWMPGEITKNTQAEFNDKKITYAQRGMMPPEGKSENDVIDATDLWKTYALPKKQGTENERAGYMPGTGLAGKVITVSKATAQSKSKMEKICKLIDDLYCYFDEETGEYKRGEAYDALRWGVGIEKNLQFQKIEGSPQVYICTSSERAGFTEKYYREKQNGAWDWGAWFSSTNDGVISADEPHVNALVLKIAEHDNLTANMPSLPQIGDYVSLDASLLSDMTSDMVSFEYKYVNSKWSAENAQKEYDSYVKKWNSTLHGQEFLAAAKTQFTELGLIG